MARLSPEDQLPRSGPFADVRLAGCLYENPFAATPDIAEWRLEGKAGITFPNGRMRLESVISKDQGQKANYVLWCPVELTDGICIEFDFYPVREPGLAMFWFCARGRNGEDLFDARLKP